MEAIIVTVGDEILIGQVIDTNAAWLGQFLSDLGIKVKKSFSISDDHQEIMKGLRQAFDEADLIFMTGGLGPTKDDITKKAIASFLEVPLFFHEATFEKIKKIFAKLDRPLSPNHHDQCLMPLGVDILTNSMGTAPGMWFDHQNKSLISMPGVPYEMKAIMVEEVGPRLSKMIDQTIIHKTILTCGMGETIIENKISHLVDSFPEGVKLAYLPSLGQVRLRLSGMSRDAKYIQEVVGLYTEKIVSCLSDIVYGYDDSSLENELFLLCQNKGLIVGTAESCTGGMIASKIVSIAGSSVFFRGGIVSYSNELKINVLQVDASTLQNYGAVSEETVIEMVAGGLSLLKTDLCIAVSGIAGPDGGSVDKPVGTIWIAVGNLSTTKTFLLKAGKDRNKNIELTTTFALNLTRTFILENYP